MPLVINIQLDGHCPRCGAAMQIRKNRAEDEFFLGCSNYFDTGCRFTHSLPSGDDVEVRTTIRKPQPGREAAPRGEDTSLERAPATTKTPTRYRRWYQCKPELREGILRILAGLDEPITVKNLYHPVTSAVPCGGLWGKLLGLLKELEAEGLAKRDRPRGRSWSITEMGRRILVPRQKYGSLDPDIVRGAILGTMTESPDSWLGESLREAVSIRLHMEFPEAEFQRQMGVLSQESSVALQLDGTWTV